MKDEKTLRPADALVQAWWVLVVRHEVYMAFYAPGKALGPDQEGFFTDFREEATALLARLQPEVDLINGELEKQGRTLAGVKDPQPLLQKLALLQKQKEAKAKPAKAPAKPARDASPPSPQKGGTPGKEKPSAARPAQKGGTALSPAAALPPPDPFDLDQDETKGASLPKLQVQGYRSVRYRATQTSGNENQFNAQNGLSLLPDKVEQRTDITVSTAEESKTKVKGRFYEFPNQEQELDLKVDHGPVGLQAGIFNASFQTGTWAVMSKKIQGLQTTYTRPNWGIGLITSQEKSVEQSESFQGNNSKGPYRLQKFPIVEGSLVVRLNGQPLAASQYVMDYFLGQITFREILDPNDLVELSYEEELVFSTSGQDSNGVQGFYQKGPYKLEVGRLSQKAGAASAASGVLTNTHECAVGGTGAGACNLTTTAEYCRVPFCLDLPHDLLVKGSEIVEVDDGGGYEEVSCNGLAWCLPLRDRDYAFGQIELDERNLAQAKKFRVTYQYHPPGSVTTLTQDFYQSQIAVGVAQRLSGTIYAGSEAAYRCTDDGLGNCINPVPLKASYDLFSNQTSLVDYQIVEANQSLLLQRDPFATPQTFVRLTWRTQPVTGTGGKRFEKQVTDMVFSYAPNEKFTASLERASSTSDIGRKPLKVVNERINVSQASLAVTDEQLTCVGGANCSSVNPNWDGGQLVDIYLVTANKVRQQVCLTPSPAPDDLCQVFVDYGGGVVTFRNPLPDGALVTANYFYYPCRGKVCRLSRGNVVDGSVSVFFDDVLNEANKLSAAVDFTVLAEQGIIRFTKDIPATVQTVIANYDFHLPATTQTIQDGEARQLKMAYKGQRFSASLEETSKDTVFAGFGIENNLDTLRRNLEASFALSKTLAFSAAKRKIETALDIQKLNVKEQDETGYDLTFTGRRGLMATFGLYERTLQDDLPIHASDDSTTLAKFTATVPMGAKFGLNGGFSNEDFEDNVGAGLKRQTTNLKLGADAKPSQDLSLMARLEKNAIDTLSPTLSYTSTNSLLQYQMDYRAFDRMSLSVDMDTQDTQDSRPGQPGQSQNTIRYSAQVDPFWRVKNLSLEFGQQDSPNTIGGKTRTENSIANLVVGLGPKWETNLTLLSTELSSLASGSLQQNQSFGLKYTGLGRLKGQVNYDLSNRESRAATATTATDGYKWGLRLFYLRSAAMNVSLQYDLDHQQAQASSTLTLDVLHRRSEHNRLKYTFSRFTTVGDVSRDVLEVNWFKRLTATWDLNTQARYANASSTRTPANDNKGFLLSTELKANFE